MVLFLGGNWKCEWGEGRKASRVRGEGPGVMAGQTPTQKVKERAPAE